jgi:hypothetical protein
VGWSHVFSLVGILGSDVGLDGVWVSACVALLTKLFLHQPDAIRTYAKGAAIIQFNRQITGECAFDSKQGQIMFISKATSLTLGINHFLFKGIQSLFEASRA